MLTRSLLDEMRCPYCGSPLAVRHMAAPADELGNGNGHSFGEDTIQNAVVACECAEYPVLDGILSLQQAPAVPDRLRRASVESLRRGDLLGALAPAMQASDLLRRPPLKAAAAGVLRRVSKRLSERYGQRLDPAVVLDDDMSFEERALTLRPLPYAHYLVQRYANPSIMAAIPLLLLFRALAPADPGRRPRIIDLGAGAGHASALLARLVPGVSVITTDSDFVNLCLARRLLGPRAVIIGLDAQAPLPFADAWFDGVFSLDTYHCIRSKLAVTRELRRVVRPGGLWVFAHIHNALRENPAAAIPLPPQGYRRCFEGIDARFYAEAAILERFALEGALDLADVPDDQALADAAALCMVATGDDALRRRHEWVGEAYWSQQSGLALNPVYETEPTENGSLTAIRQWANDNLAHECAGAAPYLPERIEELDADFLERAAAGGIRDDEAQRIHDLVRAFVLVPLPPRYRAPREDTAPRPLRVDPEPALQGPAAQALNQTLDQPQSAA